MKNIRLFNTVAEQEAAGELSKPCVTYTEETKSVGYIKSEPEPEPTFEFVDLGLPSGLKWAKCNVGAEKETDYGKYFKFGDVVGTVDGVGLEESIPDIEIDSNNNLLSAYDAATVNMGEGYRMPTYEEIYELTDNTDHAVVTIDGVVGMRFSKKGDVNTYIFIPLAGRCQKGDFIHVSAYGYLWGSTKNWDYPTLLYFSYENDAYVDDYGAVNQYDGLPLLGACKDYLFHIHFYY